jgi:hypothetical protein
MSTFTREIYTKFLFTGCRNYDDMIEVTDELLSDLHTFKKQGLEYDKNYLKDGMLILTTEDEDLAAQLHFEPDAEDDEGE